MNEMTSEIRSARSPLGRSLCLPLQAAPVTRKSTGGTLADGSGAEASISWQDIAHTGLNILGGLF